jgi:hypothetical protein
MKKLLGVLVLSMTLLGTAPALAHIPARVVASELVPDHADASLPIATRVQRGTMPIVLGAFSSRAAWESYARSAGIAARPVDFRHHRVAFAVLDFHSHALSASSVRVRGDRATIVLRYRAIEIAWDGASPGTFVAIPRHVRSIDYRLEDGTLVANLAL